MRRGVAGGCPSGLASAIGTEAAVEADHKAVGALGEHLLAAQRPLDGRRFGVRLLGQSPRHAIHRGPRRGSPVGGFEVFVDAPKLMLRVAERSRLRQRRGAPLHQPRLQLQRDHRRPVADARLSVRRSRHRKGPAQRVVGHRPGLVLTVLPAVHGDRVAEALGHGAQRLLQDQPVALAFGGGPFVI